MNFTEAVAEVLETLKRPELAARARREVNSAINLYTTMCDFSDDLEEEAVAISADAYIYAIDLTALTRFRKFYFMKLDLSNCNHYIDKLSVENMYKKNVDYKNRYYIAGTQCNINSSALASNLLVGYFKYAPTLTVEVDNRDHWMLVKSPYMIIDKALAILFASIGDRDSAKLHMDNANLAYLTARADYGISTQ